MKSTVDKIRLTYDENNKPELTLTLNLSRQEAMFGTAELKEILAKGKELSVELKQYRQKRSLDSNSYAWVLIGKIAKSWQPPVPEDDVYIEMLKRYGQHEPELISVVSEAAPMIYRATRNHCAEVGESELNGKTFKHFRILIGSSQYDSKSMATLIDGIVSECKELGIETMTPEEISRMNQEWGMK
jgi:hypothetical protein